MPFATAEDGVRLHYEVEGDGPPLVLHHGLLSSLESWRERGYVERLAPHFRLLLMDSRGHGQSDAPSRQEDYELRTRALDVGAVLRDAGVEAAHYMGYSMGCWVGYGIATYMPQRVRSLVLGGLNPNGGIEPGMTVGALLAMPALQDRPTYLDTLRRREQAMDLCIRELERFGGARQALKTTRLPLLMFAGTEDPNRAAAEMPELAERAADGAFFAVEGADHLGAIDASDVVAPRVIEFLGRVESATPAVSR